MNSLKLVSLKTDDTYIHFKEGLNYIVGNNGSGKTTIFNCIKYALGLTKSILQKNIGQIELEVRINGYDFQYRREVGSPSLSVFYEDDVYIFQARSKELDVFLQDTFAPTYIYERNTESVLELLDFCFLSEEKSVNRRQQWEAISSVCGINVSLLNYVEKDIYALKKEVSKNKDLKCVVDEFAESLLISLNKNTKLTGLDEYIQTTKTEFFRRFREKEELLISATLKFEEIVKRSNYELREKIDKIEYIFVNLNKHAKSENKYFRGLESFIRDRSKCMSYGEETFSRFILFLAIAQIAQEGPYNFPQIIVNDSYLTHFDNRLVYNAVGIIEELISRDKSLQYIEFTHRNDVSKEHIVLNLNDQGGLHVFGD